MNYQKIEKDNYNLHIINTSKFKTVKVCINFKEKIEKETITIRNFLSFLLINSSKKYKTLRDIEIETQELYNVGIKVDPYKSGNYHIMSFELTHLNEKYTEKGMNKKSLEFLLELIFNPNVTKNKFDSEMFNIIKSNIKDDIKSVKDNPGRYSLIELYSSISKGPLSYSNVGYLEDLKEIDEYTLYEYYKKMISNDWIDIFIIGDIDDSLVSLFDKYIKNQKKSKITDSHFLNIVPTKYKEKIKKVKYNQSQLAIALIPESLTEFERKYVMSLYSIILGGGTNSKLFQNVREKNSLCYSIGSNPSLISGIITIKAGIDASNYKKTVALIKKEIDDMKCNITTEELKQAKEMYISSCREINDSSDSIINNYLSFEYLNFDLVDERINNINKVKKKDIYDLAAKLVLDKIVLLEGVLEDD